MSLPGYRDFVKIASSSSSLVYRARQEALDRPVAIKVLLLDDDEAVSRFRREIEITVRLGRQHPHIVKVIDTAFTPDGRPCIVMEFYDQGSLRDRLHTRGPLAVGEVVSAGTVVADALAFAHSQGVLHRDIKPQNILVLPTSYVVADFGIARRIDSAQRTSSVDWFTFQHASPQILDGEQPTVADDVWSLGSTLFMLLDGEPPFAADDPTGNTALAYMKRVRTGAPRSLRRADVPLDVVRVVQRCMRRDRAERFSSAAEVRDALRAAAAELKSWAPAAVATPTVEQTVTATGRQRSPGELAQLVSAAAAAGRSTVEDETGHTLPPAKPRRRGRSRALLGLAVAFVLAGALGIGAALLARSSGRPAGLGATPSESPKPNPIPGTTRENINDPAIAPTLTVVESLGGGAVRLRWTDPTKGQAQFIVIRRATPSNEPIPPVLAPGTTEVTLDGLGSGQLCFHLIAVVGEGDNRKTGVSATKCTA